ncbi:MAG: DUF3084 domain-containing protein [Anaerovibrio sp.]|uniref:DUF3084 domain-containing protein n=1 Tax=Anaerovibrio sp. TaxID=1872532 RepID=UPI0025F20B25|nr:DUF3084 domain-containing protein [Anaerovibrio sp.]MCR5176174.1 DUF3084 domain-containing protein [Anaerovibrio sp.]
MYGVFLIMVLVVTGGAIAFIGDRLGSKVGKKKLTVFGMRPKYTSILVTILTGISITTMTLAVMTTVSDNVRTALFGMDKLQQSMVEAEQRLGTAAKELERAKAEQKYTDEELQKAKAAVANLHAQRDELEERTRELQNGNSLLEAAKKELTEKNTVLADSNKKLEDGNRKLEESNRKLVETNEQLESRNESLTTGIQIMREGDITFRAGEVLSSGVIKAGRDEHEIYSDLQVLTEIARNNISRRLGDQASEAEKQIWILEPDYLQASKVISASKDDMIVRIVSVGNLIRGENVRTVLQLYRNKKVFDADELITSTSIDVDINDEEAVDMAITSFLKRVNGIATRKGMLPDPISGNVGVIEGEEIYKAIDTLHVYNGKGMIYAYSKGTCEVFGPLRLKLKIIGTGQVF